MTRVKLSRLIVTSRALSLVLGNACTSAANLLALVLGFLDGFSGVFLLLQDPLADQSVLGLELSHGVLRVVNQAKASASASSKLGLEAE